MDEIEVFKQYIKDFIEKPHEVFGNLPVCPFAHSAKINFLVFDNITKAEVLEHHKNNDKEMLIIIIKNMDVIDLNCLAKEVSIELKDCFVFGGHPIDDFNINGLYTRRDPYLNIQIIKKARLLEARNSLKKSYYKNWNKENLEDVGI